VIAVYAVVDQCRTAGEKHSGKAPRISSERKRALELAVVTVRRIAKSAMPSIVAHWRFRLFTAAICWNANRAQINASCAESPEQLEAVLVALEAATAPRTDADAKAVCTWVSRPSTRFWRRVWSAVIAD